MLGETLGCGPSSTTNSTLKPPKPFVTRAMAGVARLANSLDKLSPHFERPARAPQNR